MRKKITAGNWKMNLTLKEGHQLTAAIMEGMPNLKDHQLVVLGTPNLHLTQTARQLEGQKQIVLAAQNCHQEHAGAYTGEVSAAMLQSAGVKMVILGHSERRLYAGETDDQLAHKVNAALLQGMGVIFCCGEALDARDAGTENDFVAAQIRAGLFHLDAAQLQQVVIAYEPIWAIGTGRTATSAQAQQMHAHIRSTIAQQYGGEVADNISILYGGSCKASNAAELFDCPDVDGGLIGGASLKAEDFIPIIAAMK